MSDLLDNTESKLLNHLFGKAQWSFDSDMYLALFTVAPAEDGTGGTEVSAGGYARQPITSDLNSSSGGSDVSNQSIVRFGPATADWGTVVGVALATTDDEGNTDDELVAYTNLDASVTINSGNAFEFDVGNFLGSAD